LVGSEKGVGAVDQHGADLDRRPRQAQLAVAALDHTGPHVVEQIGQQWQRAGVLGGLLRRPPGDVGGEFLGLETGGEQRCRPAHHLAQLRLAQRRHVDQPMRRAERLVLL
jgi:hypothetical protein